MNNCHISGISPLNGVKKHCFDRKSGTVLAPDSILSTILSLLCIANEICFAAGRNYRNGDRPAPFSAADRPRRSEMGHGTGRGRTRGAGTPRRLGSGVAGMARASREAWTAAAAAASETEFALSSLGRAAH